MQYFTNETVLDERDADTGVETSFIATEAYTFDADSAELRAIFIGPEHKERAEEYADWKSAE